MTVVEYNWFLLPANYHLLHEVWPTSCWSPVAKYTLINKVTWLVESEQNKKVGSILSPFVLRSIFPNPKYGRFLLIFTWKVPPDETFSHEALERYIERTVGANKRQGQEDSGLGQGYLLLDYHWQKHMGDLKFDTTNFPNPNATVQMVKWVKFSRSIFRQISWLKYFQIALRNKF